jgi:hypothetical protein
MNWNNYGTFWSIDHIIPVCKFDLTNENEKLQCWNWSNLMPVTVAFNSSKKKINMSQVNYIIEKLEKFKEEGSTTKWFSKEFILNLELAEMKLNKMSGMKYTNKTKIEFLEYYIRTKIYSNNKIIFCSNYIRIFNDIKNLFEKYSIKYIELDDGNLLNIQQMIVVKKYEQQMPLSYHYIDKKSIENDNSKYLIL